MNTAPKLGPRALLYKRPRTCFQEYWPFVLFKQSFIPSGWSNSYNSRIERKWGQKIGSKFRHEYCSKTDESDPAWDSLGQVRPEVEMRCPCYNRTGASRVVGRWYGNYVQVIRLRPSQSRTSLIKDPFCHWWSLTLRLLRKPKQMELVHNWGFIYSDHLRGEERRGWLWGKD